MPRMRRCFHLPTAMSPNTNQVRTANKIYLNQSTLRTKTACRYSLHYEKPQKGNWESNPLHM